MARARFVIAQLKPVLGMERTFLELVRYGYADLVKEVCVIGGDADLGSIGTATSLGSKQTGFSRVLGFLRVWRWLVRAKTDDASAPVVAVGVWAAVPVLLFPGKLPPILVWEHSLSGEKIATSRNLRVYALLARLAYRRADIVVAVSTALADDLVRACKVRDVRVIPNMVSRAGAGTRSSNSEPMQLSESKVLVCVGSLTRTKNLQLALLTLRELDDDYVMHILGDGPLLPLLKAEAKRLGLGGRVEFHGHVSNVTDFLVTANVLVHPSFGETFGLALYEAACVHLPVVAVSTEHSRSIVPSMVPGRLAEPTPRAFAEAIRSVVTDGPNALDFETADMRRLNMAPESVIGRWKRLLGEELFRPTA